MEKETQNEETQDIEGKEGTVKNNDAGNKYETTPIIERTREEREKLDASIAAQKVENDRAEAIMAKRALGGQSEAGIVPEKPKKMTDVEYAEALVRGEVDPLKEDGLKI